MSDKDHYKLTYFDVRGIAEPIRLLLHYAGQKFEDVRIPRLGDEWRELKKKTPLGQLPILDINQGEIVITQSGAIARFLANKYGLAGKDALEKARVDELHDWNRDIFWQLVIYIIVKNEFPPEQMVNQTYMADFTKPFATNNKEQVYKEIFLPGLEKFLPVYEKILRESKSNFLVDSGLTYVDFFVADFLHSLQKLERKIFTEHYTSLIDYVNRVYSLPQIKEHMKNRKEQIP